MRKLCAVLCLVSIACGGDETSSPDASPQPVQADAAAPDARGAMPGNTVAGTIAYAGTMQGDITVALYEQLPAMGPPKAFTRLTAPTYPASFELTGVAAGSYQLMVVLDIGGDNPTLPGDEDIQVPSAEFTVTDERGHWLDVVIEDP